MKTAEPPSIISIDLERLLALRMLVMPEVPRLTMLTLGAMVDIDAATLSRYRNGRLRNIEREILAKICWFFGCQPSALLRMPGAPSLTLDAVVQPAPSTSHPGPVQCLLTSILEARNLSIQAGALLCAIPYPTFRRWALDTAQSFHLVHLTKACRALNVGVNDLLRYEPGNIHHDLGETM